MNRRLQRAGPASSDGWLRLREVCRSLRFEPHDIARQLDERGRYDVELNREFPFLVKLFRYTSRQHTRGATWHERLELFLPLDGPTRFRMGDREVALEAGDLLIVDNFKLHHVVDFPGFDTRAIVVSFLPEFVYSLGSPSHDYTFLLPFYNGGRGTDRAAGFGASRRKEPLHVLRSGSDLASPAFHALASLLERYFGPEPNQLRQAGCKAAFLSLLYVLARHCATPGLLEWEFVREQERALRLKPLFDHISRHYPEKLRVEQAATMVKMSAPQFMKLFKKVAGMTLVTYVNHVRLSNAARLLRETAGSIAEIADQVGFADQSYFDKQFKRAFGCPPKLFRNGGGSQGENRPNKS